MHDGLYYYTFCEGDFIRVTKNGIFIDQYLVKVVISSEYVNNLLPKLLVEVVVSSEYVNNLLPTLLVKVVFSSEYVNNLLPML